jgi:hypothetical protein
MRAPKEDNQPLYNYTHMPTNMKHTFPVNEMQGLTELADPFSFTKGCKTMKIPRGNNPLLNKKAIFSTMLFDLKDDPKQENPLSNPEIEEKMIKLLISEMKKNDAPVEQYERLGLIKEDVK